MLSKQCYATKTNFFYNDFGLIHLETTGKIEWTVARIKNFWQKAEQPSFWPSHIPFCSPSARMEIEQPGIQRVLNVLILYMMSFFY